MQLFHFLRRTVRRSGASLRSPGRLGVMALTAGLILGCDGKAGDPASLPLTIAEAPPDGGKGKKNKQPIADPGGPYTTTDGTVQLDGTGSRDPDGPNNKLTHLWTFHDGSSATGATPTKEYAELGEYTVTLIVTDRLGLDSEPATTTVTYTEAPNEKPVADPGGPYETTDGTVTFDGSGSDDPDGANENLIYAWSFGDEGTGEGPSPTHVYAETGSYTVTLVVTDEMGLDSDPVTTTAT